MAQKQQTMDSSAAPGTTVPDDGFDTSRRAFAEDFALMWEATGSSLMDGRILGYLMITRAPFVSSADLVGVLNASAGSVSMSTRRLVESGFIKRHVVPGDRSHYFRTDDDIWGSWLAGERRYLDRQRDTMERGLQLLAEHESGLDEEARRRLVNGRDYMIWLAGYHRKMLVDWEAFKSSRDNGPVDTPAPSSNAPDTPSTPEG